MLHILLSQAMALSPHALQLSCGVAHYLLDQGRSSRLLVWLSSTPAETYFRLMA
jgi:hypothetical protein